MTIQKKLAGTKSIPKNGFSIATKPSQHLSENVLAKGNY